MEAIFLHYPRLPQCLSNMYLSTHTICMSYYRFSHGTLTLPRLCLGCPYTLHSACFRFLLSFSDSFCFLMRTFRLQSYVLWLLLEYWAFLAATLEHHKTDTLPLERSGCSDSQEFPAQAASILYAPLLYSLEFSSLLNNLRVGSHPVNLGVVGLLKGKSSQAPLPRNVQCLCVCVYFVCVLCDVYKEERRVEERERQ